MVLCDQKSLQYQPDYEFNRVAESLLFQAQYAYDYYLHYMYNYLRKRKPYATEEALHLASHIHAKRCADKVLNGLVAKDVAIKKSFSKQLFWYGSIHGSSNDYQQCEAINNQQLPGRDMYFHNSYLKQNWKYLPNGDIVYENTKFTSLIPICFADSLFLFDFCLLKPGGISQRCGYLVETAANYNTEKRKLEPALKFTLHVPKNDLQEFNNLEEVEEAKETQKLNGKLSDAKVYYTPRDFDNDIQSIHTAYDEKTRDCSMEYLFDNDAKDNALAHLDDYMKNDKNFLIDENTFDERYNNLEVQKKEPIKFEAKKASPFDRFKWNNQKEKNSKLETPSKTPIEKKISYFQKKVSPKILPKDDKIREEIKLKEKLFTFSKNKKPVDDEQLNNNISFSKAWFNKPDQRDDFAKSPIKNNCIMNNANLSGPKPFKVQHNNNYKNKTNIDYLPKPCKELLSDDEMDDLNISKIPPPLTFNHLEKAKKMREEGLMEEINNIPKFSEKKNDVEKVCTNLSTSVRKKCQQEAICQSCKKKTLILENETPYSTPNTHNRAFKETPSTNKTSEKKKKIFYTNSTEEDYKGYQQSSHHPYSNKNISPHLYDPSIINELTSPRYVRTVNKQNILSTPKNNKKNKKYLISSSKKSSDKNIVESIIKLLTPKSFSRNNQKMIHLK
uniref:Uncharacterized protein n=1 Tax=Parastrongyloides trichosuri TaxID=131310 RepID=A0A0N5A1A1_PARTI